jgi:hypothetical protein
MELLRVSSQRIASQDWRVSRALFEMSSRLPIGVEMTNNKKFFSKVR